MKTIHIAIVAAAVPLLLGSCRKSAEIADLNFAKSTFESLARGDTDAASKIDWETFTSMGVNVGAQYVKIPSETEKQDFRKAFVTQFSSSFRDSGGSVDSFVNWRVIYHDENRTDVAADSPKGTLNIAVTERDSVSRVSALSSSTKE